MKTYGFNTLSLQMSWTLFLWTIRIMPSGWSHASPPTRTGTTSQVIQQFDEFFAFYAKKNCENIWFLYTLSLQISWTLFLWTIRIMPGGWSQASPSTWTGTPSSPRIRMTIDLHWAIRCLCRLTILEAPMCMEPNTATTLNYT